MEIDIVEVLLDFLTVAIHDILYSRSVYPEEMFLSVKRFNVPVHVSRHPEVNSYIKESLDAAKTWFEKGEVKKIVLHIEDREGQPIERHIFDIKVIKSIVDESLDSIVRRFGDFFLNIALKSFQPLPKDSSFSIVTYTTATELGREWMLANQKEINRNAGPSIKPIKSLITDIINVQLFVEENVTRKEAWVELEG